MKLGTVQEKKARGGFKRTSVSSLEAKVQALKRLQAKTATEVEALMSSMLDKAFKGEL